MIKLQTEQHGMIEVIGTGLEILRYCATHQYRIHSVSYIDTEMTIRATLFILDESKHLYEDLEEMQIERYALQDQIALIELEKRNRADTIQYLKKEIHKWEYENRCLKHTITELEQEAENDFDTYNNLISDLETKNRNLMTSLDYDESTILNLKRDLESATYTIKEREDSLEWKGLVIDSYQAIVDKANKSLTWYNTLLDQCENLIMRCKDVYIVHTEAGKELMSIIEDIKETIKEARS